MKHWKLRGRCASCKRNRWFIRTVDVRIPGGLIAHGRELLCGSCGAKVARTLSTKRHD
jgi:hypothetical protein